MAVTLCPGHSIPLCFCTGPGRKEETRALAWRDPGGPRFRGGGQGTKLGLVILLLFLCRGWGGRWRRAEGLEPGPRAKAVTELELVPLSVPLRALWLCRPSR